MSNPFQLQFTLRQHTPLIHFQHHQDGATLRATEVKPKLDRFIIEKLGDAIPKSWFIGDGSQKALNYKIRVIARNEDEKTRLKIDSKFNKDKNKDLFHTDAFPLVIANMGGKETKEELKNFITHLDLKIEFNSFFPDLIQAIKQNIGFFLFLNNFGNRQSKGFGSFYIHEDDPNYINPQEFLSLIPQKQIVWFELNEGDSDKDVFDKIDIISRLLKAGFNFPDYSPIYDENGKKTNRLDYSKGKGRWATYQKSFLLSYFNRVHKIGSEKREIKERLFRPNVPKDRDLDPNNKYVRAVLGVAELFEYRGQDNKGITRNGTITVKSDEIERFKSPITFKVIGQEVYLLVQSDWNLIKNGKFKFSNKFGENSILQVPNETFELESFIVEFAKHFNSIKITELDRLNAIGKKIPNALDAYHFCLNNVELLTYTND